ncbi:unnamed protein product [Trichogramma brassicae]|uniref:CCHC-type domain-containing protein n=1 Tax=Trichogramma brassicae TaxID=86971 RepID=A0A6H5IUD0_9HYME|nr:unnamed protein product [Trichogramma brassicae]
MSTAVSDGLRSPQGQTSVEKPGGPSLMELGPLPTPRTSPYTMVKAITGKIIVALLALQGKGCQAPVFRGICDRDLGGQAGAVGRPYTCAEARPRANRLGECRIRAREEAARCYRCWSPGHVAARCKGPDRTELCYRCGQKGHQAKDCKGQPSCVLSAENEELTTIVTRPQARAALWPGRSPRTADDENPPAQPQSLRGCPGPALRHHQQAAHRRGHLVRAIQEPCSTQHMARRCRRPSSYLGAWRNSGAGAPSAGASLLRVGPNRRNFLFSASTLRQDSLRGNFPPSLPTSPRRPAAEGPLLLRGTSTHGRRSGDVGRLDRGRPSCSTRSLSSMRCCLTPGSSIVDLTFVCETLTPRVLSWTVSGLYTHSDHQAIVFEIEDDGASSRPSTRRSYRWNARTLDVDRFSAVVSGASVAPGTAEDMASSLMSVITGACDASMTKANPRRRREPVYWWTPEIADLRRSCLRARRLFQRSRGQHDEETHSANYASARRLLRMAIKTSKRRCWRQLCDEVNNDVWGKPYRIAMSRLGCPQAKQPSSPLLVRGAVSALFPRVPRAGRPATAASSGGAYTGRHLGGTQRSSVEDKGALRARPGWHTQLGAQDRYCRTTRHLLAGVYDVSETGVFPSGWKRQRLVLLPKPGKPPDEPSSYRPLCMLDTAGKILERIICDRLELFTERPGGLSERQYGFRKGRSTIDAIEDVVSAAREAIAGKRWYRGTKKYCAVVTLDVRNAFNSARWDTTSSPLYAVCSYPITC